MIVEVSYNYSTAAVRLRYLTDSVSRTNEESRNISCFRPEEVLISMHRLGQCHQKTSIYLIAHCPTGLCDYRVPDTADRKFVCVLEI